MLIAIGLDDAFHLGVLSSHIHTTWSLHAGGTLEDRPRYTKVRCFDPFPFPAANNIQKHTIRTIAEELDAHRKAVLETHSHLTMTALYNVLALVRVGVARKSMNDKDCRTFDDGLVLVLRDLHDRLDTAVTAAYGWPADLAAEDMLEQLVALNHRRAEDERRSEVAWLRPEYQIPRFGKSVDRQAAIEDGKQVVAQFAETTARKPAFPSGHVAQTAAIFAALTATGGAIDANSLAARFRRTPSSETKVRAVLASLARIGYVTSSDGESFMLRRSA